MWDTFARIAVVAAVVVAIAWLIASARYVFWVRIRNGVPKVGRGKLAAPFLRDLIDVCGRYPIERGWVGGVRRGRHIQLAFSRSIPEPCRQQLRNLWNLHR
jgi:Protein of unknown function (DUF3634)